MWNWFVNVCLFITQFVLILSEFLKNCLEHRVVLAFEKSTCFPPNQFSSMTWLFFIPHVVFKIEKNIFPLGYFHPFYKLQLAHCYQVSFFDNDFSVFYFFLCFFSESHSWKSRNNENNTVPLSKYYLKSKSNPKIDFCIFQVWKL